MKRLIFFTLAAFIGLPGFGQTNEVLDFSIKGKIDGKKDGYVYLSYPVGKKYKTDSAAITNGTFAFKGKLNEPVMASLSGKSNIKNMDDPNTTSFFIDPVKMELTVNYGAFKDAVLKGSRSNDEYEGLNRLKAPIRKEMEPVSVAYKNEKDPEKAAVIRERFEPFNEQMDKVDEAFIDSHPDSFVSVYLMSFKVGSFSHNRAKGIYNSWTERLKQSATGKGVYKEILELESGSPGAIARVFTKSDINGERLNLADFKGKKYVLIDFWASWCVPCRKGNPHLLSLYHKYKDKGLEIIGVSDDDSNHAAWKKAVDQDKIGIWKHVLRGLKRTAKGYDRSEDITEAYGISSLPTKILIDKNGIIIGRYGAGGEDDVAMDKKMEEIFNKKNP
ncbi:TlpA disulfide reductase family protein [Pedobacter nyackensis]|uniref:TlpA disulfide reductase family protein n=1 Tax=Pedobacter nyackensis TaxID=475255 RepID=UPI00292CAEA7|nr:TlpA disulfide reductase family protein [Pedobacter nyackensis]